MFGCNDTVRKPLDPTHKNPYKVIKRTKNIVLCRKLAKNELLLTGISKNNHTGKNPNSNETNLDTTKKNDHKNCHHNKKLHQIYKHLVRRYHFHDTPMSIFAINPEEVNGLGSL